MVEEKWKKIPVWADNHHKYFKWVRNFCVVCDQVWLVCYLAPVCRLPAPPAHPPRPGAAPFLLLRSREKGLDTGGKEGGSESWRTVNHVNSSVRKFCKALIIQDAGCHPNAINSMFLTLLLRKVFFMEGWFCCIVWRKGCLTGTSANTNLFILY